jgi:hypothetical protein
MKVAVAGMAVVLAVALLIGAGQDQDKTKVLEEVRAGRFLLVDEENVERGVCSTSAEGKVACFFMHDNKGIARFQVIVTPDGNTTMFVRGGKMDPPFVQLHATARGTSRLSVRAGNGRGGIDIGFRDDSPFAISIMDRTDRLRTKLTLPEYCDWAVECFDQDGKPIRVPISK